MSGIGFSEELRHGVGDSWQAIVCHPLTDAFAAGTVPQDVLQRYLIQDHKFLDAFVILLSSIIAHARTYQDRLPGCQFLGLVTSAENNYFERSFEALGTEKAAEVPPATCTTDFCNLMKEVANSGSLAEMLSVIVVCEWSYLSWATRVLPDTIRTREDNDDRDSSRLFITYEWIDLHSGPAFEQVVSYFRGLLDQEGPLLTPAERERCQQRFSHAVQLEIDFFDMANNEKSDK